MRRITSTIIPMATTAALTQRVAAAMRKDWHRGDIQRVAAAAIDAVCAHLAQSSDEGLDPRLNLAVESFLAYEYREADDAAARECSPDDIPGQLRIDFEAAADKVIPFDRGAPPNDPGIDPYETIAFNVENGPKGVRYHNVRAIRPLVLLILASLAMVAGCGKASTSARDRRDGHQVEASEPSKPTATTGHESAAPFIVGSNGYVFPTTTKRTATRSTDATSPPAAPPPHESAAQVWANVGMMACFTFGFCFTLWVLVSK